MARIRTITPDQVRSDKARLDDWRFSNLSKRLEAEGLEQDARLSSGGFIPAARAVRSIARRFGDQTIVEDESAAAIETVPGNLKAQAAAAIARGMIKCESPIEKALLPWLVTQRYQFFNYHPAVLFPGEQDQFVRRTLAVVPQLPIGRYRADFALAASLAGPVGFVIVECDGKEFHDGVENVVRDLNRDVAILNNPRVLSVVRISGVEIMTDPRKAAQVAARGVIDAWAKKPAAKR